MNRKTTIASIFGISFALLTSTLAMFNNPNIRFYNAQEPILYSLSFNSNKNKLTKETKWSSVDLIKTELDSKANKITFKADGVKDWTDGWQSFNDGGYFTNIDHIIGMDSISFNGVTTSGEATATVYYSGDLIDATDLSKYKSQTLTFTKTATNQSLNLDTKPNYILTKFTGEPVDIKSSKIIINNECKDFYSTVTINGLDDTMGSVSGAGVQFIGSEVTLVATAKEGYEFKGWYDGDTLLTLESSYTFIQPVEGITLNVKFEQTKLSKPNKGEVYKFGTYPQTHVTDNAIIANLDKLVGTTPDVDSMGWTNYSDYYVESINDNKTARWFKDVELDSTKYRAVYMTLAPAADNGYATNTTHYFRFDSIEWNVLDDNGLVLSKYLLDSSLNYQHDSENNRTIDGKTIFPNNYEHSDIRAWLNNSFLNDAFSAYDQNNIAVTNVDNSGDSYGHPGNQYACNNTQDKIFIMSKSDVYNEAYGFTSDDTTRIAEATDYAKCMGCWVDIGTSYGLWWLRSPYFEEPRYSYILYYYGDWDGFLVDFYDLGIRPALTLAV